MEIRGDTVSTICPEARGCTLSLALTDGSTTQWEFTIEAGVGHAWARVGVLQTAAPSAGSGKTRWIGWAHNPAATAWRVSYQVLVGAPNATAELELAVSSQPTDVGLLPNGTFAAVLP